MWQQTATKSAVLGLGAAAATQLVDTLVRDHLGWVALLIFGPLLPLAIRLLRRKGNASPRGPYGNYEQGLPCWQGTTWKRPRRSEF